MVDESFHLTPLDARRYDFGSALRGYDKTRVDQFREQVADELERLAKLNQDLEGKAKGFHEQLRAFRERDKALNEALVSAQQLRAETREQAEREAQLILREARAEAERLLAESRAQIVRLQASVDSLERTRRAHIAQLRAIVQRQLTEIDAAEQLESERATTAREETEATTETSEANPESRPQTPTWLDASVPE
jgi:DivIVA domain-containing protein